MPIWTRYLRRPRTIEELYESTPSLDNFRLSELDFDGADSTCLLRGTLAQFPDFPKSEWESDANRAGIRLWLEQLVEFDLEGWSFENIVDLRIEPSEGVTGYRVRAEGDDLHFDATCNSLHLASVYAYHSTDGER